MLLCFIFGGGRGRGSVLYKNQWHVNHVAYWAECIPLQRPDRHPLTIVYNTSRAFPFWVAPFFFFSSSFFLKTKHKNSFIALPLFVLLPSFVCLTTYKGLKWWWSTQPTGDLPPPFRSPAAQSNRPNTHPFTLIIRREYSAKIQRHTADA